MMITSAHKNLVLGVFATLVLVGICFLAFSVSRKETNQFTVPTSEELQAVRKTVTEFGKKLKMVSLLAPNARELIDANYSLYVTPELIAVWKSAPEDAPGKLTSNPYPEDITVVTAIKNSNGSYTVEGTVREVATTEVVGVYPVTLTLKYREGAWLISQYTKGAYSSLPQRIALTGIYTCLPHKNTEGPHTMECALGMQTDDGVYYALDFSLLSQTPPSLETGERFQATGVLTPIENLSTNFWQKYAVSGIFSITDSVKKL